MDPETYYLHRVIANWIQTAGVLFAAAGFLFTVFDNRRRRLLEHYENISTQWLTFLKTVREHPEYDLDPLEVDDQAMTDVPKERIKNVCFLELFVLLERVYLLQSIKRSPAVFEANLLELFIDRYIKRADFRVVWDRAKNLFDTRFRSFVDLAIHNSKVAPQTPLREVPPR